jgi:phosphatidylserine/phosphatidylglycerophosphate/cardiolipin synthase-like enzyme
MALPSRFNSVLSWCSGRIRVSSTRFCLLIRLVGSGLIITWIVLFAFHLSKPLPEGISVAAPMRSAFGMEFLHDLTFQAGGHPLGEQRIFDRILSMIDAADDFIVIDMFLFNGEHGGERAYRPLSVELTEHLVSKKTSNPGLRATFITDEINNFYGAYTSPEIERLQAAGVEVITTRMSRLRDSNPAYSSLWRMFAGWFGTRGPGWLPHPLSSSGQEVTARAYFKLLNFKANHRKLIVTDNECLITSANPHDASSFHSNVAFTGEGPICADLLAAERAVAAFSGGSVDDWPVFQADHQTAGEAGPVVQGASAWDGTVQLVTEGKILEGFLTDVGAAGAGDRVDLAMFYVSERKVVKALLDAAGRGASVRLILDPNKDAFGREKGGIPNRQVATELLTRSGGQIDVRGSANLTRRNIGDYNLEADLRFSLPREAPVAAAVHRYLDRVFGNEGGDFTLPYEAYQDDSWLKRILYRLEEFTGFCSF